jgi:hypothetical protein
MGFVDLRCVIGLLYLSNKLYFFNCFWRKSTPSGDPRLRGDDSGKAERTVGWGAESVVGKLGRIAGRDAGSIA